MTDRKTYHVTRQPNGNWQGKAEGAERASVVAPTKEVAVEKTVEIAKKQNPSQVVIHKQTGQFQSERTYGNDPSRTKG